MMFDFTKRFTKSRRLEFVEYLNDLSDQIGFKVSSRGWCYIMEQNGMITKSQFNKVESAINACRKEGLLPVDFVANESSREFSGVVSRSKSGVEGVVSMMLDDFLDGGKHNIPNYWEGEEYYIQVLVEKVDLVTLFKDVCRGHRIPIGNAKGWQSILQRADYLRRFKEAKKMGLKPVLLYCGDFDPDGRLISDIMRKNLRDVEDVYFEGEEDMYEYFDVDNDLIVDRFGLNLDFINQKNLSWIDNLETGRGGVIAVNSNGRIIQGRTKSGRPHPNFHMDYVQDYLSEVGVRKCEANALVTDPLGARDLMLKAIEKYLGPAASTRFSERKNKAIAEYNDKLKTLGLKMKKLRKLQEKMDTEYLNNLSKYDGLGNFR